MVIKGLKKYVLIENKDRKIFENESLKFLDHEIRLKKVKPTLEQSQDVIDF